MNNIKLPIQIQRHEKGTGVVFHWYSLHDAEGKEIVSEDGCKQIAKIVNSFDAMRAALELFCRASMFESRPSKGESLIGWQDGDGTTAREAIESAKAALAAAK